MIYISLTLHQRSLKFLASNLYIIINVLLSFQSVSSSMRQVMANKAKWDQIVAVKTACVPNKEIVKRPNGGWKMVRMLGISFKS